MNDFLNLPSRAAKPRNEGISLLIDNGRPTTFFKDVIVSHKNLIDII